MQVSVQSVGLEAAIAAVRAKAKALSDLTPAYKRFGAEIVKKTDDAFHNSKGYDGEAWPALAQSTIDSRLAKLPGANRRNKKTGKLTAGARTKRRAAQALIHQEQASHGGYGGLIKPMVDTARARNSSHADSSRDGVTWSAVGYLGVHMAGTDGAGRSGNVTIPKRNPSPFELKGGKWVLRDSAKASLAKHLNEHINAGSR